MSIFVGISGSSDSFSEIINYFNNYFNNQYISVQYYPSNGETNLFNQSYHIILLDYMRHMNLFQEYTAIPFYKKGSHEKIMVSYLNDTIIIGFPNTEEHPIISESEDENHHRLNFIISLINSKLRVN